MLLTLISKFRLKKLKINFVKNKAIRKEDIKIEITASMPENLDKEELVENIHKWVFKEKIRLGIATTELKLTIQIKTHKE